jgi:outer membrane receptor for ferrienterochelin and colicins
LQIKVRRTRQFMGPMSRSILGLACSGLVLLGQLSPGPAKPATSAEQALVDDLPVVQAAALHQQTLQEAPANVTVISRAEIRKYGYRTLAEALNSVRGLYLSYDRIYHYLGASGISLPGDFNTRVLVMINGHSMTEHVYDSNNFFGQDFDLDMDFVERIEIIRGSASALYGSNAMLATINVITRSPVDMVGPRVSTETDSFGQKKVFVSDSVYLGKGANLLIGGSVFDDAGQTIYVPQFNSPATNNGVATNSDGETGYHAFANLVWGDWTFTAYFGTRRKQVPVNFAGNTLFDEQGLHARDGRNFVEASRTRDLGASGKLRYRFYWDDYRYDDRFDYAYAQIRTETNHARNDYLGSEVTWSRPFTNRGELTVGLQGEWELRNLQYLDQVTPVSSELFRVSVPDRTIALFTQQEWRLSPHWKVDVGLRYDRSRNYGQDLSPRIALVYQQSASSVFKAVYGHPFRNPSAYEKYFNDGQDLVQNLNLHAETANTFELSEEHKFGPRVTLIVAGFQYRIRDLIEEVFPADGSTPQFQNVDRARSTGIEMELSAKLPRNLELLGSATMERAVDGITGLALPNSPRTLAKLRLGMPILKQRAFLSSSAQYMSARGTNAGDQVSPYFLQDITITTRRPPVSGVEVEMGVRNLWNRYYADPVGIAVDTMIQDGRSFFVKMIWQRVE